VVEENRAIATIAGAPEQQLELSRYYDALAKSLERAGNGAGNVRDALDLHERALGIASKALGAAHPDVVKLRMNYGIALKKQGRFAQARAELEAALDSIPATQRASYLDAGIIHGYLSEVSYEEGKLDSAAAHGRESVAIFERGGAPDRRRAEAYADLANTELKRKRFAEALALYERALGLRKDLAGDHYQLGVNQGSLAEALVGLSRYDEAMVHLREAERIFARGSAQDRATQAWILTVRGEVLVGQHQLGEAVSVLEHVLPMCEGVADRSNQAYATWTLARALHGLGRSPERVRQLAEQARALFAGLGGHEAPDVDAVDQLIHQLSPVPVSPSRASRP
jgi:tetratricopeptide (TPR) repeat protein